MSFIKYKPMIVNSKNICLAFFLGCNFLVSFVYVCDSVTRRREKAKTEVNIIRWS